MTSPGPLQEPRDYVVVLTFENGRRDPSSASAMTLADAEAEAAHWRGMRREPARLGAVLSPTAPPMAAEVCRLVKVR